MLSLLPSLFLGLFLEGCAVLPSALPPIGAPSTRTVVCISRTLAGGTHLQVLEHRVQTADPEVIAFLDAHPGLDGRLLLSDLLFLERLAGSRCRTLLSRDTDALRMELQQRLQGAMPGSSDAGLAGLDPVDLCKASLVLDALRDAAFLSSVSAAINADAADLFREHGGLALIDEGSACGMRLLEVASAAEGDHDYVLPGELFTAGCLAFWHDHAFNDAGLPVESLDNRDAAGPSGSISGSLATVWGDRWVAYLRGIDGLVFTPTGGRSFAAVYFTSEGATLDLGRYAAP